MDKFAVKYAGGIIPRSYVEKIIASIEGPAYFGLATVDQDDKGPKLTVLREPAMQSTVDEIMEMQELWKDKPLIMILGERPGQDEDVQPFVCLSDHDDRLVVVAFATGEYNSYVQKGSSHTPVFHAITQGARPKLLEIYDAVGGKLEHFDNELKSILLNNKMEALGSKVALAVFSATGHIQGFEKEVPEAAEQDWGYGSDMLGFGQPAKKEEPAAPEPKLTLAQKLAATAGSMMPKVGKAKQASAPVSEPAGAGDAVVHKHPESGKKEPDYEMLSPPANLTTNRELANWYRQTVGYVPPVQTSLRKERPKVPSKNSKIKSFTDLGKVVEKVQKANEPAPTLPATPPPAADPRRETKDTPLPATNEPNDPASPELTTSELTALLKGFMKMPSVVKILDYTGDEIIAPEVAAEMGGSRKTLNQLLELDGGIERWKNMRRSTLYNLAGISRKALVLLFEEYRFAYWNLDAAYRQLAAKHNEKVASTTPTPASTKQVDNAPVTAAAPAATSAASVSTASKSGEAGGTASLMPRMSRRRA